MAITITRDINDMTDPDRKFLHQVFMGSGDWTDAQCKRLHALLDNAFGYLSGLQQSRLNHEFNAEADRILKNTVLDIAAALDVKIRLLEPLELLAEEAE